MTTLYIYAAGALSTAILLLVNLIAAPPFSRARLDVELTAITLISLLWFLFLPLVVLMGLADRDR